MTCKYEKLYTMFSFIYFFSYPFTISCVGFCSFHILTCLVQALSSTLLASILFYQLFLGLSLFHVFEILESIILFVNMPASVLTMCLNQFSYLFSILRNIFFPIGYFSCAFISYPALLSFPCYFFSGTSVLWLLFFPQTSLGLPMIHMRML